MAFLTTSADLIQRTYRLLHDASAYSIHRMWDFAWLNGSSVMGAMPTQAPVEANVS